MAVGSIGYIYSSCAEIVRCLEIANQMAPKRLVESYAAYGPGPTGMATTSTCHKQVGRC